MSPIHYVYKLTKFAFREYPLFYFSLALGMLSAGVELAAMATLYPLSILATGETLQATSIFVYLLNMVGLAATGQVFLMLFCVCFSIRIVTQLGSQGLFLYLGRKVQSSLSDYAFRSILMRFSVREIEEKKIGYYMTLAGDEASRAGMLMIQMCQFTNLFALSALYYCAILRYSALAALGVALFLSVVFVCLLGVFRRLYHLGHEQIERSREVNTIFMDALNGLRSVKAFLAERFIAKAYKHHNFAYTHTLYFSDFLLQMAKQLPVLILLGGALVALSVGWITLGAGTNFPFVVTLLFFLIRFFPALGQCFNVFLKILTDAKAGQDITHMIDPQISPEEANRDEGSLPALSCLQLKNVTFSYGNHAPVLKNVNMTFKSGKSYALVGPSGVGKSTLADCLLRFYCLHQGQILLDGVDALEYGTQTLRQAIVLIGQETTLISDTVFANIAFGQSFSQEAVEQACRLAEIHETILALPEGYETLLQYQGSNLSGGQRQRLGIARALVRSPHMLVFDESTSALDKVIQYQVVENILSASQGRIVLFITHDPAVAKSVDEIIDMPTINQAVVADKERVE